MSVIRTDLARDAYNLTGIEVRKAIYVPVPQSVPMIACIDEHCVAARLCQECRYCGMDH